jgi:hypothetical protein
LACNITLTAHLRIGAIAGTQGGSGARPPAFRRHRVSLLDHLLDFRLPRGKRLRSGGRLAPREEVLRSIGVAWQRRGIDLPIHGPQALARRDGGHGALHQLRLAQRGRVHRLRPARDSSAHEVVR